MSTAEQLTQIYPFSDQTLETVENVLGQISTCDTPEEVFKLAGITDGSFYDVDYEGYMTSRVLDIHKRGLTTEYDNNVIVAHQGLVNPLDQNNLYQIACLSLAKPRTRILASSLPGGYGFDSGLLTHTQRQQVAQGNAEPFAVPLARYMEKNGYPDDEVKQFAFSFGNEKMFGLARCLNKVITQNVSIEPVSVVPRGMVELGLTAAATLAPLGDYVAASEDPKFTLAQSRGAGQLSSLFGTLRATNMAASRLLKRGEYENNASTLLEEHLRSGLTIVSGTDSEYDKTDAILGITDALQATFGARVKLMRLMGQQHVSVNYLPMQIAIAAETL